MEEDMASFQTHVQFTAPVGGLKYSHLPLMLNVGENSKHQEKASEAWLH